MSKQEKTLLTQNVSLLKAVSDAITVNRADNGWMVEITGRDSNNGWITTKTICIDEDDLIEVIKSWNKIKIDR